MKDLIYCEICKKEINQNELGKFTKHHLKKHHNINSKNYYDKFLKKENEGICLTCGKETRFQSIVKGYTRFCNDSCVLKNKNIKKQINKSRKQNEFKIYGCWYIQTDEYVKKTKKTKKDRYGDENYCNVDKIKQTFRKKYGVDNFSETKQFRQIMEDKGLFIPLEQKTDFQKYRMLVENETKKWKKELLKKWDGLDYYTGEKLITYTKYYNHPLYKTIDHKISIYYGFKHKINPEEIGNLKNLCITSRKTNSKKKHKSLFIGGTKWALETEADLEVV